MKRQKIDKKICSVEKVKQLVDTSDNENEFVNVLVKVRTKVNYESESVGKLEDDTGIIDYEVCNNKLAERIEKHECYCLKNVKAYQRLDSHFIKIDENSEIIEKPDDRYPSNRDPKSFNSPLDLLQNVDVGDSNLHLIGEVAELEKVQWEDTKYKGIIRDGNTSLNFIMWKKDFPRKLGISPGDYIEIKGGFVNTYQDAPEYQINPYDEVSDRG